MTKYNISFAGAGRVGSALCRELFNNGYKIDLVVSETAANGKSLADSCNAFWSDEPEFPGTTDIIVVAVPDQRLKIVLNSIKCRPGTLIVHTAGSLGMDAFPDDPEPKGVFYPLQSFTFNRSVSFAGLPFFLEASDNRSAEVMKELAESTGGRVYFVDSEHRRMLHIAAVFVSNFTNHMLFRGKQVTDRAGLSFDVLIPLINETISKALALGPEISQTGPAVRNDNNTIEKHLELLSFSPELHKIYEELTQSIIKYYDKDK